MQKKTAEDSEAEEQRECLAAQAAEYGEESDEGASAVNVESNMDAEVSEETEDGSF